MVVQNASGDWDPVPRDENGRKMYPGRFWSWPTDLPPIDTYDGRMQYGIALWTNTNDTMPSIKQLVFLLSLLESRVGADADNVWNRDVLTKRECGAIINALLRLPPC